MEMEPTSEIGLSKFCSDLFIWKTLEPSLQEDAFLGILSEVFTQAWNYLHPRASMIWHCELTLNGDDESVSLRPS